MLGSNPAAEDASTALAPAVDPDIIVALPTDTNGNVTGTGNIWDQSCYPHSAVSFENLGEKPFHIAEL